MQSVIVSGLLFLSHVPRLIRADECADYVSCSPEASSDEPDGCCVPTPGGLFLFRQRFEAEVGGDAGSWGIDGIDVLE